jgi:NAD(P)H dehydrogenase (quinone)
MKVLIVFAHPEPKSFNGALFDTAVKTLTEDGHQVATSDLYRMAFNPVSDRHNFTTVKEPDFLKLQTEEMHASEVGGFAPDLEAELRKLEAADLMIWQFPLWWFGLPAILKGWVDRVFAMGRVYGHGHIYETGMFQGKRALLSLTTGGPRDAYRPDGLHGDVDAVLRPIERGILQFTGFSVLPHQIHWQPVRVEPAERHQWLDAWRDRLRGIEHEAPLEVGRY